jgi:signal transduction histidine kinase
MSATLARRGAEADDLSCAREFSQISESLARREALLLASAKASRLLLEVPDVKAAIPAVLQVIGEAASVDRVHLMLTRAGPRGEPLLVVSAEWVAEGVAPCLGDETLCIRHERDFSGLCAELRAGRSVCLSSGEQASGWAAGESRARGFEGIETKTKAIVPIFVAGEFIGIVAFDNTRQLRAIEPSELAALETAAGVIGAALHRERLIDDVRRERERTAEEQVAELARANAVIRGNLERLASEPDLHSFMGHMLLEATRQFDAATGAVIVAKESAQEWRLVAYAQDGHLDAPPFPKAVPIAGSAFTRAFAHMREPFYLDLEQPRQELWPGELVYDRDAGCVGVVVYPMVFGARTMGFFILGFRRHARDVQRSELFVALTQQATLAVQLTRLGLAAKEAAVLTERTRIGQEIHDGLAQAFTGILLQLGAVEELAPCRRKGGELAVTLSRIRELARDGLSEARRSVMALRLDQSRRAGLDIALRQLAERSTVPGGVRCTFEGGGVATGLLPEHEHELLRIAQEAVSNAVRHGQPASVRITMDDEPAHWVLAVSDDGVGMEEHPEEEGHASEGFGLISMRQRAGAIGGQWQIESRLGEGTRVSVRLPKRRS